MKKTIVISSIFCTILFFLHCTIACLYYSQVITSRVLVIASGCVLGIPLVIHMVTSLISMERNAQKDPNASVYAELNANIVIQSATGIFSMVFLVLHVIVNGLSNAYDNKPLFYIHAALEFIFILILIIHLAVGLPKLFLSLGLIKRMKSYRISRIVVCVLLIFPLFMYVISSIQYHFIYAN